MSEATDENLTYSLPSTSAVLETQVSFPFEEQAVWAKGFNHLKFVKGKEINVNKTLKNGEVIFEITMPENPNLIEIISAVKVFMRIAEIKVNYPNSLSTLNIFCRDLRNSARVLKDMARNFDEEKQKEALEFINSLYQLGEGLEKTTKAKNPLNIPPIKSLDDQRLNQFELPPQETDLEGYKNNLLLFLLGKNYQSFAEDNRQDPKLYQVAENSTYYSWFNRYWQRKKRELERKIESDQEIKDEEKIPETYEKQTEEFDKYLLDNKEKLFSHIFPFIPESLQEGGRGDTAFWEVVTHNVFSLLDQAIEEEGWQKAKEPLKPPPLFTDLGKKVQKQLKQLGLLSKDLVLDFSHYHPSQLPIQDAINEIKQKAKDEKYGKMSLFQVAQKIFEKNEKLSNEDKIKILWDLVQAYGYEKTYLLTSAVEEQAFECNLRSYILSRLLQQLMGSKVEIYTVNQVIHTLLLVFDKSTKNAYWVDPTDVRFQYVENERKINFKKPFVNPVNSEEWQSIQQQIKASPDNFHIFGNFTINKQAKFATILPFRQGIEASFWSNFGGSKYDEFESWKKALALNPNNSDCHYNIALVYTERSLAEAMVRERIAKTEGEKLTEDEKKKFDREFEIQYLLNLLQAEKHYKEALALNPNDSDYHYNIALVYTERSLAEAMVRERIAKTEGEKLTEDEKKEVEIQYHKNFNDAFWHMGKAYEFDPTIVCLDAFFWVVKQIPDNQAQQVFKALTSQTRQLILQMYKIYQEDKKPELRFGSNFKNTQFWQLINDLMLQD